MYYQLTDPYVPHDLYDPSNALVYCDGCNRLYHQKCHFVPLLVVPRGTWHCLVCSTSKDTANTPLKGKRATSASAEKKKSPKKSKKAPFSKAQLKRMFQSPPPLAKRQQFLEHPNSKEYHSKDEMQWEMETNHAKAVLWHKTLTQTVPSAISSALSNWRQAETAFEALTRTQKNRQHFLQSSASRRGSQELAQTLAKLAGAKLKMRQIVMNLEQIRVNPDRHTQLIQKWCMDISSSSSESSLAVATAKEDRNTKSATACPPPKSFLERIVFPFGHYPPRTIPRTAEKEEIEVEEKNALALPETMVVKTGDPDIPSEIVTTTTTSTHSSATTTNKQAEMNITSRQLEKKTSKSKSKKEPESKSAAEQKREASQKKKDSDVSSNSSSGVSLDDLKCCVCLIGDATDENDLLLCDGKGCFRAYHFHCLEPRMTQQEVEAMDEDDNWFCPLCSSLAECMHMIQSNYMGDDWDRRRIERDHARALAAKKKKKKSSKDDNKEEEETAENNDDDDDDDDSLKSWDLPTEVFPRAQWEYDTATQLKAGNRNDETNALLRLVLDADDDEDGGHGNELDAFEDDTDDEVLDEHFDLVKFEEERRHQREEEEGEDDDSTHSSQATLVDMSSVELSIDKDELNALSEGSDSDSDKDSDSGSGSDEEDGSGDDSEKEKKHRRRSRRLRHKEHQEDLPKNIGVDYDPANIVQGKRRRKHVDYKRLNEAMFGELDESEIANIDDKEDFRVPVSKKNYTSAAEEDSDSDDESGSDDDNSSDEENDNSGRKPGRKGAANRKRSRSSDNEDSNTDSGNEAGSDNSSDSNGAKKKKRIRKPPAKKKKKKTAKSAKESATSKTKKSIGKKKSTPPKRNGVRNAAKKNTGKKPKKTSGANPKPKAKATASAKKGGRRGKKGDD